MYRFVKIIIIYNILLVSGLGVYGQIGDCYCDKCLQAPLEYEAGQRVFYFPDSEGNLRLVNLDEQAINTFDASTHVEFHLYTRKNPDYPELITELTETTLSSTHFDKTKPTKFIIHGWLGNGFSEINIVIKNAFLKVADVNVICVNWGYGADTLYSIAVANVPRVGDFVGKVLDWFIIQDYDIKKIHLIGHSLGAHVAAIGARSVMKGKIPLLTGLDPANPLWDSESGRICKSDAEYVEIIHTNAGNLGILESVGHNDFYPNGGKKQPGCSYFEIGCSHSRSYKFYAQSIINDQFTANKCENFLQLLTKNCTSNEFINMGGLEFKPEIGLFYLKTAEEEPYYLH